jgi:multisubunit Na+/H+ antiporter MnhC subunit
MVSSEMVFELTEVVVNFCTSVTMFSILVRYYDLHGEHHGF